jgi:hypothetical protein
MKRKIIIFTITVSLAAISTSNSFAQEAEQPLIYNPVIKKERSKLKEFNPVSNRAMTSSCDTLLLPFVDDFSAGGIYPDTCLWTDSNVFVNDDFPVNPPSIGVATFDGLNKYGEQYNPSLTSYGPADTLTSKPIDLDFPNDTTVWLSFYYQPQGLGTNMQPRDSLVLELFGSDNLWHRVWSKTGSANAPFALKMYNVRDTIYLFRGFRFRFINYASLYGMIDQWNLDYIRLDTGRSATDTVITNDVAFVKRSLSALRNYQSVPYAHYKNNELAAMDITKNVVIRNLDTVAANPDHSLEFLLDDFSVDYSTGPAAVSVSGNSTTISTKTFSPHLFPSITSQDSLVNYIRHVKSPSDSNPSNDTLLEKQELYNYYCYDDGTAEAGYGVPTLGARIAYKFDLLTADSLRAIQMRFIYGNFNVSLSLFNIMLWNNLNPNNNGTQLLFSQHPYYGDSINEFYTYILSNPVAVSGTFYIGWEQLDASFLNIGLDKNINSNANMFYTTTGTWQNSSIPGSWMIRPVFGKASDLVSTGNNFSSERNISMYPNPASEYLIFKNNAKGKEIIYYLLTDISGRVISEGIAADQQLNVSDVPNGMYMVIFSDVNFRTVSSHKLIISR